MREDIARQVVVVAPHRPPRPSVHAENVVVGRTHEQVAVESHGLTALTVQHAKRQDPLRYQVFDRLGVDLVELAVAGMSVVLAIKDPVVGILARVEEHGIGDDTRGHIAFEDFKADAFFFTLDKVRREFLAFFVRSGEGASAPGDEQAHRDQGNQRPEITARHTLSSFTVRTAVRVATVPSQNLVIRPG